MNIRERVKSMAVESSGTVSVEGATLNYIIEGEGIPCVVIGSSIYDSRAFSKKLRKHLKCIFVDARHFGKLDPQFKIENITLDTYLDDIEQVRTALKLGKICILGHSIHGLLALEYALKYPQNTSHAIIIGIAPIAFPKIIEASAEFWESDASEERKKILQKNQDERGEDISKMPPDKAFVQSYIANAPLYWYDPTYDCSWLWEGVEPNANLANHVFGVLFKDYDITDRIHQIKTPVFLAIGRYDYVVPYTLWDNFKDKMPNLSYNLFERSGHTPQLEEQTLFDEKLIDWIKGH